MRSGWAAALAVAFTALTPARASAQWQLSPFVALTFGGDTTLIDLSNENQAEKKHFSYGGVVRRLGAGPLGFEVDFGHTSGFFGTDSLTVESSGVTSLMGNVVVAVPKSVTGESLRPYASGGFGVVRASTTAVVDALSFHRNLPGFNVGGGVFGFVSRRSGLQWDVRYFRGTGKGEQDGIAFGSTRLSYWRASMAFVIRID
jgi:hypothetical protein